MCPSFLCEFRRDLPTLMIYPLFTSRTFLSAWETENINVQNPVVLVKKQTYTEPKAVKCALVLLGPICMENTCLVPDRRVTRLPRWANFFLHFLTKLEEPFTSETKSWLSLRGDLLSRVTLQQVLFTVHIPQVRIQVTMLQINKQAQKCLLALNVIQNVVFDGGEITYNYVVIFVVTCGIWPVSKQFDSPAGSTRSRRHYRSMPERIRQLLTRAMGSTLFSYTLKLIWLPGRPVHRRKWRRRAHS